MRPGRIHLIVLGCYTALSLLLSWPLVTRLTTHTPGVAQWAFDEATFLWNIWYFKDAVVDRLSNPLHSELIWHPLGIDLVLYTYNFFHALVAMPMAVAVTIPFASNIALLASTVLSGYGTFLLVLRLLRRERRSSAGSEPQPEDRARLNPMIAAFVAGLVYAFASNRAVYAALGHYDMVTTQWIPFYALMLLRSLDERLNRARRQRAAALAGLFFAFTGLAEMISALFLAIFTLIVLVMHLRTLRTAQSPVSGLRSLVSSLLITGLVAFLVWSPALVPIVRQFLTEDFSLKGWGEAIPLSTDLLGWFTPTILHPFFGGDLVAELRRVQLRALAEDGSGFRDVNTVFLGWFTVTLALLAIVKYGRRVAVWTWTTVIFGLFTLGPFLQINGRYQFDLDGVAATVPLPYALLHYLPIIKANRAPNRNSVLLMLGLAVLVGYALYWLLQRTRNVEERATTTPKQSPHHPITPSLLVIMLAAALLFEHLALPAPLSDMRVPAVYAQIAADPRPVSILQAPLGWRNSFGVFGAEETRLQFYQSVHGKPMLGGNISRAPDFKMGYFQRLPYFQALTEIEFGRPVSPDLMAAAKAQAAELAYLYNVGYLVLFPPIPERYPYADTWRATWDFLKSTLPLEPTPFWRENGIEAYRVIQPAGSDEFTLDLGIAGRFPYLGEGWDSVEVDAPYERSASWATAAQSRLFIPLRQGKAWTTYTISLRAHPFAYPDSPPQSVALTVNGEPLAAQPLPNGWQELRWTVDGALLNDGLNRLEWTWGYAVAPRTVTPGSREIGGTGRVLPVDVDLKGFADGGFIALFDETGQQRDGSAGRRGVNVTVLDAQSGAVKQMSGFDTTANAYESESLAAFLRQIEPGAPVLVVSHGDASAFLTADAVEALRGIGADLTLEALKGQYFAIIGVQGAAPGAAVVVIDPHEAFLRLSLNQDRRTLAAAVDWVSIKPADD
jgi:hypothetical protein